MTWISRNTGDLQVGLCFRSRLSSAHLIFGLRLGNQVTPFTLTSGSESLYAWHVLPVRSVLQHEDRLQGTPIGHSDDITEAESFKILKEDPDAQLIISCQSPTHLRVGIHPIN